MNIISPIPQEVYLAFSGGIDSMFGLHFLLKGRRKVHILTFNHGTFHGDNAEKWIKDLDLLHVTYGKITRERHKKESPEEYYRNERYKFFSQFNEFPIITCHHLNDQVETAIMAMMQGKHYRIPYKRDNYLRPFLNITKKEIEEYAMWNKLWWIEDISNQDITIPRNRIRNIIIPTMETINPGFYKHYLTGT